MGREKRGQQAGPDRDDRADVDSRGKREGFHRRAATAMMTTRNCRRMAGALQRTSSLSSRTFVPHTMLSPSPSEPVPHTMLSPSPSEPVPQTMLSQSAPPHSVPQTMLS